VAFKEDQTKA